MAILGIDLGTTNSLAVVYRNNTYELIPNQFGEYLTPSVVSLYDDNSIIVGRSAKERLVTHPQATVELFKRNMGSQRPYVLNGQYYTAEELSAIVLQQLVKNAEDYLQEKVEELVISVPAYFDMKQRSATKRAGEMLGLKVERLINEPSAAALACRSFDEDETFIVFDFGGGTLDVTVVDCFDNVTEICSIAGNNHLGGSDFDFLLAKYICKNIGYEIKQLSSQQKASVIQQCERIKRELQIKDIIQYDLSLDGKQYKISISNDEFYALSSSIFQKIRHVLASAMNQSGLTVNEIDYLVLVGGSCHMPIVQRFLRNQLKVPVKGMGELDSLVVKGLGTYLGIKQREEEVKNLLLTDICPFSLAISTHNEEDYTKPIASVIIPKNTVLPASKTETFYKENLGKNRVHLQVFQGEQYYCKDNLMLGEIWLNYNGTKGGYTAFDITYMYDINSLLVVEISIIGTDEVYRYFLNEHGEFEECMYNEKEIKVRKLVVELHQDHKLLLIEERVKRLIQESPFFERERIIKLYKQFQEQYKHINNLRKKQKLMDSMLQHLYSLEESFLSSELFIDEEQEEGMLH